MPGLSTRTYCAVLFPLIALLLPGFSHALTEEERAQINFVYASYLGTGFYKTSESEVFVLQIPWFHDFRELDLEKKQAGLRFNLPLTIGLSNFKDRLDNDTLPKFNDVTTFSILPGLEYLYPMKSNWSLHPFIDYGIAYNFGADTRRRLLGTGLKSLAYFSHGNNTLVLGNRLLYAKETNIDSGGGSDYAVFETGLDYQIPTTMQIFDHYTRFSVYFLNLYYPNEIVFISAQSERIRLNNANEIGVTVSLPQWWWLPDDPRIGFGIRYSDDVRFYRVVFGMPFF